MDSIFLQFAKEAILAPVLIWFMYQQKKFLDTLVNQLTRAVGKTVLTSAQAIDIGRDKVKASSIDKLDFIRRKLEKNNLESHQDKFKEHIKAELSRLSAIYVEELNKYNIQGKIYLGDFVSNAFPMTEFLEEIYESVFMKDVSVDKKMQYIQTTMMSYQNAMWEDARVYFNKK